MVSEFAGKMLDRWVYERGIRIDFSRPGKPTDNATVESFNGRLRQECLNENWFMSLEDARCKIEAWRIHYNQRCPPFCAGLDDALRICRKICRLPEYAARLKPVIPDYEWIIFGVRVSTA
ncbi:Integrase core domain [Cedecea neteri]|uniref:Integrase core domain n=1 Tax=Cedecea neteri TaxID=158822 RepID=A0A2X3IW74_9ENTR|nr:Integrase core domain [Cedecea neteri]